MSVDEESVRPDWHRTGNAYFPAAASVEGHWWILRINSFPDHPLWTLFVDGIRRSDFDDLPRSLGNPANPENAQLDSQTTARILAPVTAFVAYGSEVGSPCTNEFCCG